MGHGNAGNRRLLRGLVAGAATGAVLAIAASTTLPAVRDRSQRALDERVRREVLRSAQLVRTAALTAPESTQDVLREQIERIDGVELLHVETGEWSSPAEVRLLFRVRRAATAPTLLGYQRAVAVGCFTQLVDHRPVVAAPQEVPCPPVLPTTPPPPSLIDRELPVTEPVPG